MNKHPRIRKIGAAGGAKMALIAWMVLLGWVSMAGAAGENMTLLDSRRTPLIVIPPSPTPVEMFAARQSSPVPVWHKQSAGYLDWSFCDYRLILQSWGILIPTRGHPPSGSSHGGWGWQNLPQYDGDYNSSDVYPYYIGKYVVQASKLSNVADPFMTMLPGDGVSIVNYCDVTFSSVNPTVVFGQIGSAVHDNFSAMNVCFVDGHAATTKNVVFGVISYGVPCPATLYTDVAAPSFWQSW